MLLREPRVLYTGGQRRQTCPNCTQLNVTARIRRSPNATSEFRNLLQAERETGLGSTPRRSQNPPHSWNRSWNNYGTELHRTTAKTTYQPIAK
jgi:hypothetical protein